MIFLPVTLLLFSGISCSFDCDSLRDEDRDQCLATEMLTHYKDDPEKYDQHLKRIKSDSVRDYVLLELTRSINPHSRDRCDLIKSKALRKRCLTLVSRPHLHRTPSGNVDQGLQ